MDSLTVGREAGVIIILKSKLNTGFLRLHNCLCFVYVNVRDVIVLQSEHQSLQICALHQVGNRAADVENGLLAVDGGSHSPIINGVEHTQNQQMCIGIEFLDSFQNLNVVHVVAHIAVQQTLSQSTRILSGIVDFNVCGQILIHQTQSVNDGNQNIQSLLQLCHGLCIIKADSCPIKLVRLAIDIRIHNAVYVLTGKGKEVTAANGNGDHISLLDVLNILFLSSLESTLHQVRLNLGIVVIICLNFTAQEEQQILCAQRTLTEVTEIILPTVIFKAIELLCQQHVSRTLDNLIYTVLHVIDVTIQTVTVDGTVTQRYVVGVLGRLVLGCSSCNSQIDQLFIQLVASGFSLGCLLFCTSLLEGSQLSTNLCLQSVQVIVCHSGAVRHLEHLNDNGQIVHVIQIAFAHQNSIQSGILLCQICQHERLIHIHLGVGKLVTVSVAA